MKLQKFYAVAALLLCSAGQAHGQATPASASPPAMPDMSRFIADLPSPPADPAAILLRPAAKKAMPEQWTRFGPTTGVRNVVNPTLTPFLPDPAKATGAAVIVAPGGAFRFLSMEAEGTKVARWLADRGIAAFLLKYRTVPTPRDIPGLGQALMGFMSALPKDPNTPLDATAEAVEDAQAAVSMVRARAAEWKIDPAKVGFIGYSAGAMTALGVGLAPDVAARPDFIAPVYPPMMARPVGADAPPMFLAIALNDELFAGQRQFGLIDSWRNAKRPLEVHLYEKGGHGFSMQPQYAAASLVLDEFVAWMQDRRILLAPKAAP